MWGGMEFKICFSENIHRIQILNTALFFPSANHIGQTLPKQRILNVLFFSWNISVRQHKSWIFLSACKLHCLFFFSNISLLIRSGVENEYLKSTVYTLFLKYTYVFWSMNTIFIIVLRMVLCLFFHAQCYCKFSISLFEKIIKVFLLKC